MFPNNQEVISTITTSSASLVGSPISKLPPSALILIFTAAVDSCEEKPSDRFRIERQGLPPCFTLTHVCQQWKEVALNCSTLWTRIEFCSPECSREMLARSKGAPLRIVAVMDNYWQRRTTSSEGVHAALQHISRIQELSLTHKSQDLTNLFQTMTSPARALECLSLRDSKSGLALEGLTASTFAGVAPKLRSLLLSQYFLANWDVPILHNVVHFSLYDLKLHRRPDIMGYLGESGS